MSPQRVGAWQRAEATVDKSGMRAHVRGLAGQLAATGAVGYAFAAGMDETGPRGILVAGMGGSAIAGDLVAAHTADRRRAPLATLRGYDLPAWADPGVFLIASSYSGNTEETLSVYRQAKERGLSAVAVTTGGRLAEEVAAAGDAVLTLPGGLPPRAALGHSLAAVGSIVARVDPGLDPADEAARLAAAAEVLDPLLEAWLQWDPANPALEVAETLAHRLPLLRGAAPLGAAAAVRWRGQLAENAKLLAHSAEVPEHDHNEIVALEGSDPFLGTAAIVWLETPWDHPRARRRMEIVRMDLEEKVGAQLRILARGEDRLQGLLWLCGLGDCASFLCSVIRGVDPTPVHSIDRLKAELDDGIRNPPARPR